MSFSQEWVAAANGVEKGEEEKEGMGQKNLGSSLTHFSANKPSSWPREEKHRQNLKQKEAAFKSEQMIP